MTSVDTVEVRHVIDMATADYGNTSSRVIKEVLAFLSKVEEDYDWNMSKSQSQDIVKCAGCGKTGCELGSWGEHDDELLCEDCFKGRLGDQVDHDYERVKDYYERRD